MSCTKLPRFCSALRTRVCLFLPMHTLTGDKRKGFPMDEDLRLGLFITFLLLAAEQKNCSASARDFIFDQPVTPEPFPLTRFVEMTLDRVRDHEFPQAIAPAESGLTFRLGSPNPNLEG